MSNTQVNLYTNTAIFYDLDIDNRDDRQEIQFYIDRLPTNKKVLDLTCGTGRITIPLAKKGFSICGVDLSKEMLAILQNKIEKFDKKTRNLIHLSNDNMVDFEINDKFGLILITGKAFQSLTQKKEQIQCLKNILHHLDTDGKFIFDIFNPWRDIGSNWVSPEKIQWKKMDFKTNSIITKANIARHIDTVNQIIYPEYVFYVEGPNGDKKVLRDCFSLQYYYQYQIEKLISEAGFNIVEKYGSYSGEPLINSSKMIFVCEKS